MRSSWRVDSPQLKAKFKIFLCNPQAGPEKLENVYRALLTVKPTSTDLERKIFVAGSFVIRNRNRMGSETLDSLVFLKYSFMRLEKQQT